MTALELQLSATGSGAMLVTVVAFSIGGLITVRRVRRGSRRVDLRAEVLFRLAFVPGILTLPWARSAVPRAALPWPQAAVVVGVVVAWFGLLLWWWSFRTLGRFFTPVLRTSPHRAVVDHGPHRVLRHPSYTGLLMVALGCALMIRNSVGMVVCCGWVGAAMVYRIRVEERALTQALGAAYLDVAATRARLVPFVW